MGSLSYLEPPGLPGLPFGSGLPSMPSSYPRFGLIAALASLCQAANTVETIQAVTGWEVDVLERLGGKSKGKPYYMYVDVRGEHAIRMPNLGDATKAGFSWRAGEDVN